MKILKIVKDVDIGSAFSPPEKFSERKAARAIVFDAKGRVALLYSQKNNYHKLPGGGVEEGEGVETALRRELIEEIGCTVGSVKELGLIEEYRNESGLHQISYCYIAHLVEKGAPQLEANEILEEYVTKWLDLDTAIEMFEKENAQPYKGKFIQMRDGAFLKEAKLESTHIHKGKHL